MQLTKDEFVAYFNASKQGTYTCPFCGSVHFDIAQTWDGSPAEGQINFIPGPGIVQPGYHSYYAIICGNCARTDFFHATHVDAWVAANLRKGLINQS
jgi:predicted nucleic-acid-binding Zn-ribbon protein